MPLSRTVEGHVPGGGECGENGKQEDGEAHADIGDCHGT